MSKPPHHQRGGAPQPNRRPQQNAVVTHQSIEWEGPIPPPAVLEHVDRIVPGGAERILKMAEQEQSHRMEMQKIAVGAEISDNRLGKVLGAGIAALAIMAAVANSWFGGPWQATAAFVGVPILGVVNALVQNRRSK